MIRYLRSTFTEHRLNENSVHIYNGMWSVQKPSLAVLPSNLRHLGVFGLLR